MSTSIHLPRELLDAVDRRARALRVSRNRFIRRAVEREVAREDEWSPGFFEYLRKVDPGDARALRESMREVASHRLSKKPPRL